MVKMHIAKILDKAIKHWPEKEAIVCANYRLSYRQFAERVQTLANLFISSGVNQGNRVAIIHHNCHIYLEAYFAAAYADLILSPINYRLSARELGYILRDSGAKLLIANVESAEIIKKSLLNNQNDISLENIIWTGLEKSPIPTIPGFSSVEYERAINETKSKQLTLSPGGSAPAHLYYTSGTTGEPKGVILTHENVVTHAQGTITEFKLNESDVWGHIAPMYHLADAWATFAITQVGGKHLILPKFEPKFVLEMIRKEGMTISNLIPTMLNQLVNELGAGDVSYPSLRYLLSGGAPIAPELVRKIIETFKCEYVQTYGMTETSPYLTVSLLKDHLKKLPENERFKYQASTGRKFITVELKVVNEQGQDIAPDNKEVGEIWVRGPTITPGYWHRPDEDARAFEDDWLKTGDLATIDSEGYVNIVDRKKDMIVTGGENVYSTEVEHVLYEHPAILEAAIIGVPDDKWGEAVKAVVVLKQGNDISENELIQFCKTRLAHYKAPKSVDFVPELPKTGTGKIYKKGLKDRYWVGHKKRVH